MQNIISQEIYKSHTMVVHERKRVFVSFRRLIKWQRNCTKNFTSMWFIKTEKKRQHIFTTKNRELQNCTRDRVRERKQVKGHKNDFRVYALSSSKAMLRDLCMRLRLERDFHLTITTAAAFNLICDHLKVCKDLKEKT
jgi:hypothetical protein